MGFFEHARYAIDDQLRVALVITRRVKSAIESLLHGRLKPWQIDLFLVAGLLCLNPVVYGIRVPLNLTPDAISYFTFAESAITTGKLYLPGWGHVDTAMILPPLYPMLISLANAFHPDSVGNALALSGICMLMVTVVIYFCVRRFAPPAIAAAAVLLTQLNLYYVYFASSLLTEALFLLIFFSAVYLAMRIKTESEPMAWQGLALGMLAGLTFLARQVGLLLGVFLAAWLIIDIVRRRKGIPLQQRRLFLLFMAGWLALLVPYAAVLYYQTGETIFHQSFRMHTYMVATSDAALLSRIDRLEHTDDSDYITLYRNRRQLLELLPDGSEMLAYVMRAPNNKSEQGSVSVVDAGFLLRHSSRLIDNLASNIAQFTTRFGQLLLALALFAFVTPFVLRTTRAPSWPRLILPGFLLCYSIALSTITGAVARYFIVLFPLAVAQIAIELGVLFYWWRERRPGSRLIHLMIALVFALLLLFTPHTILNSRSSIISGGIRAVEKVPVLSGEPAFALLPVFPYLAGGTFRALPNDTLEKVVHYAHLTGVRWLLVPRQPERVGDEQFYTNAKWLRDPGELRKRTDLLQFCCTVGLIEEHLLFEILPSRRDSH